MLRLYSLREPNLRSQSPLQLQDRLSGSYYMIHRQLPFLLQFILITTLNYGWINKSYLTRLDICYQLLFIYSVIQSGRKLKGVSRLSASDSRPSFIDHKCSSNSSYELTGVGEMMNGAYLGARRRSIGRTVGAVGNFFGMETEQQREKEWKKQNEEKNDKKKKKKNRRVKSRWHNLPNKAERDCRQADPLPQPTWNWVDQNVFQPVACVNPIAGRKLNTSNWWQSNKIFSAEVDSTHTVRFQDRSVPSVRFDSLHGAFEWSATRGERIERVSIQLIVAIGVMDLNPS